MNCIKCNRVCEKFSYPSSNYYRCKCIDTYENYDFNKDQFSCTVDVNDDHINYYFIRETPFYFSYQVKANESKEWFIYLIDREGIAKIITTGNTFLSPNDALLSLQRFNKLKTFL